ncbi:phosphonate metabolism protein/1,5-bisphosphokinase (PRPP-forming) PhnN [Mesorhizobium sp. ZC-5]|uniref:phosphonate metabolism protein/1,5-bisphosphokinase (PRPP-forming) PhnN n=1 Tax=Mesorhizobium sp. ZC-5 TaxID=2986066 RepID=UPI0021E82D48|nr:phosphonate metabolism protein/1,5-bisphosphokinase (PRPP-forming) PhnN [Mesorhizobium sp. ZC-5]MCV3239650.1 phosphonate metabolism protein/1,5-bisphosphokinase (PRPP-forming) PhnN [Mesorhizobium sp. ZC-5]
MMVSALIERELTSAAFPLRGGVFIAVVGPSGAGKDTIIDYARERLDDDSGVEFVRRVITRPSDAGSEDHDTLADAAFDEAEKHGAFALSWPAHGLKYGLPASVDRTIADGRVAIANLSRGALAALRQRYANVAVVEITARHDILAERLSARGRESRGEVLARLARTAPVDRSADVITIDNSGARDEAGERFLEIVRKAIAHADLDGSV